MRKNPLDCIHETFLYFLRGFFWKVGFFVGSHPWPVIVCVNLFTVFCAYGAISIQWPFAYNPALNDNVLSDLDGGFAQQDGTPLLNKKWSYEKFGHTKVATIMGYASDGEDMFHPEVLRDLARLEKRTLNTTLIPWRNFGFYQYHLDGSLGFFDFCARSCPKADGCGCQAFSIFSLLKADHADVCNDANTTTFDLDACYAALDQYYEDAASTTGHLVETVQELAKAHERPNCHDNTNFNDTLAAKLELELEEPLARLNVAIEAATANGTAAYTYQALALQQAPGSALQLQYGGLAAAAGADAASWQSEAVAVGELMTQISTNVSMDVTTDFLKCTSMRGVPLASVMEEPATSSAKDIMSTRLFLLTFLLGGRFADNQDTYLISQWQRAWLEMMLDEKYEGRAWNSGGTLRDTQPAPMQPYEFLCSYSNDYSNEETTIELLTLLPFSIIIVLVLVQGMLVNPFSKLAGNKGLANAVIQTACVSPAIGIGIAAWSLIPNGPLNLVCFFLCIGTAMADTFIMTAEAGRVIGADPEMPLPTYGATVLSNAGPFGLMTTITTVIAFGIGMNTVYPSMVLFAKYAMLVMSCAHLYVITYFIANLCLCQDRIRKRKMDGCPCISVRPASEGGEDPPPKKPEGSSIANTRLERFILARVAPAIISPTGKVLVMTTFLALVGASAYGVTRIEAGLENSDVSPSKSHFTHYANVRQALLPKEGASVNVYLSEAISWYSEEQMRIINNDTFARLATTNLYSGREASPWLTFNETCFYFGPLLINGFKGTSPVVSSHEEAASGEPVELTNCYQSEEAFHQALYHFMYTPPFSLIGLGARESIVHDKTDWAFAVTKVHASRMTYSKANAASTLIRYHDLVQREEAIKGLLPGTKQVSDYDTLDGLEPLVLRETFTNIAMGALAVFASMTLFIKPAGAVIVVIVILFLDLLLMAFLPLTGTKLNAASSICIVMAVGFAVDYSSDIVFAFFVPKAMSHDERAKYAMVTMAQPIIVGGGASVSTVLPLIASSVPTASVFAIMVSGIVGIGFYMGFIVLPVLLALLVPLSDEAQGKHVSPAGVQEPKSKE